MSPSDSSDPSSRPGSLERSARLGLTLVLAGYGFLLLRDPDGYGWLDDLDLAIHETGHLVFGIGGETLGLWGGTLFQLLIPIVFGVALWRRGDRHGATVPLWWLGQSCLNVARYVRDARAQELPLVAGGEHDWFLILDSLDLLHRDLMIGRGVWVAGLVLIIAAVGLGLRFLAQADALPGPSRAA